MAKAAAVKAPKTAKAKTAAKLTLNVLERVILYVRDFDAAVKYYTETLGVPLKYQEDGWAALDTKGIELNLHAGREGKVESHACVSFKVGDFDAAYEALKARGVKVSDVHSPCGGTRCSGFTDLDGNQLSIEGK